MNRALAIHNRRVTTCLSPQYGAQRIGHSRVSGVDLRQIANESPFILRRDAGRARAICPSVNRFMPSVSSSPAAMRQYIPVIKKLHFRISIPALHKPWRRRSLSVVCVFCFPRPYRKNPGHTRVIIVPTREHYFSDKELSSRTKRKQPHARSGSDSRVPGRKS